MQKAAYDFDTDSVSYQFDHRGTPTIGRISVEALQDHFGASGGGGAPVEAYLANASAINARASAKLDQTGQQPVILMTSDF